MYVTSIGKAQSKNKPCSLFDFHSVLNIFSITLFKASSSKAFLNLTNYSLYTSQI